MVRDDSHIDLLESVGGGAGIGDVAPAGNSCHLASEVLVPRARQTHGGDRGGEGENRGQVEDADVVFQAGVVE